jgi:hypothetical protein
MLYLSLLASGIAIVALLTGDMTWGALLAQTNAPTLTIPLAIPAQVDQPVTIPIRFQRGGAGVGSIVFSVDFDESCLGFDPRDENLDGLPDAIRFHAPPMFRSSLAYNGADVKGELDFVIADYAPPIAALPDTDALVEMTFNPLCQPTAQKVITATVAFSQAPMGSFGDLHGNDLIGVMQSGAVIISTDPLPTPTIAPTPTPTPVAATPTATATLVSTLSPTVNATVNATVTPLVAPTALTPVPSTVTPTPPRLYLPVVTR